MHSKGRLWSVAVFGAGATLCVAALAFVWSPATSYAFIALCVLGACGCCAAVWVAHAQNRHLARRREALRASDERLRAAAHKLEGMAEAIMVCAADGRVVMVNRAFCELTGFAREEVVGRPERAIRDALQPPEFCDKVDAAVRRDGFWSGTSWSRRKNGSLYHEWRAVRAVRQDSGPVTHYVTLFYEVGAAHGCDGAASPA